MPLKKRLVRVTLKLPKQDIILDERLYINIKVRKAVLSAQSAATIDIGGLSRELRESLLSQFTAYKKRQREQGDVSDDFINVIIEVGYQDGSQVTMTPIFHGQVTLCDIASPPPNIVTRLTCFTQQIDKTKYNTVVPHAEMKFKDYCTWAAGQMGLAAHVDTSMNDTIIQNPGTSVYTVSDLVWDIQRYDRQGISAYIDDNTLFVMDVGKVVKGDPVVTITEFIGIPTWVEYGASFTVMFNPMIKLARGVNLQSEMNPTLGLADMVVTSIEYDLATRDRQFVMRVIASPSA